MEPPLYILKSNMQVSIPSIRILRRSRSVPEPVPKTMRRRLIRIALILLLLPPLLAALVGWLVAPWYLKPIRRALTPDLIREADGFLAVTHVSRQHFEVRAPDGVLLRGWTVTPPSPNGSWVLLFHGVADNRVGVIGQSEFLLRDRKSTRLNSSHRCISYAVFCLKKKKQTAQTTHKSNLY